MKFRPWISIQGCTDRPTQATAAEFQISGRAGALFLDSALSLESSPPEVRVPAPVEPNPDAFAGDGTNPAAGNADARDAVPRHAH